MTGVCPQCQTRFHVSGRRGSKVANHNCPTCKVPLQGPNAGRTRAKFWCLLDGRVRTLGVDAVQLDQPHRIEYVDPGRGRLHNYDHVYTRLQEMHGTVLGAGAVVATGWMKLEPDEWYPARLVPLTAAEAGDPSTWLVNQQLKHVRCRGCGAQLYDTDPRPQQPWTPVRTHYIGTGRRWKETIQINMGPHPAGSPACRNCLPEVWASTSTSI